MEYDNFILTVMDPLMLGNPRRTRVVKRLSPSTSHKSLIVWTRLKRRIYFFTFVESLEMIFSQKIETCEVLLDYSRIGGDGVIKDDTKSPWGISCMQILIYTAED